MAVLVPAFSWAQLGPGDIVFLRYNTDSTDAVSWAPMVPLAAGEQLYFTEQGWVNGAWIANTESHYLYTAPAGGLAAGTVVHFESATPMQVSPGGGTLVKVFGANEFLNLSAGDQVLAYTSSTGAQPAAPVFLGGVHGDHNWGNSTDGPRYNAITTWNIGNVTAVSDSHLPLGLTNAHTAISLFPSPGHQDLVTPDLNYNGEKDNARYKLTAPTGGTRTQLLFALNNPANWDNDDITAYASNATVPSLTVLPDPATGVLPLGAPRTSLRAGALSLPSYEVPAGENRLLVVGAANSGSTDITGVSFGGTPMTQVVEQNTAAAVDSIWVLPLGTAITSTTGNVVVTHAGAGDVQFIGAIAFARVDQSTPTSGAQQFAGSGSPHSFTVTSAAGDLVLDTLDLFAASPAPTTAPAQTRGITHFGRSALSSGHATYAMSMASGSASVPIGWTHDGTSVIHLAVNLRQASAAPATTAPTVTTDAATTITHQGATLGGNVTSDGGASVTDRGIVWATTPSPTTANTKVQNGTGTGTFSAVVNGMAMNTPIYVRAYATNSVNTSYGNEVTFTTLGNPVLSSPTATGVTATAATLGGNVTSAGGLTILERGVVFAPSTTNTGPTVGGFGCIHVATTGTLGVFTVPVAGLTPGTQYHYSAYAQNSLGYGYTAPTIFTTGMPLTVTSLNRVNPTPTNATTVNWTLTFPSATTGLTSANFTLVGAAAAGSLVGTPTTSNNITWNVPVTTGSTDGLLTLRLANDTGLSASYSVPFDGDSYTIDKTAPTVLSVTRLSPTGQNTNLTTLTFRVTYSEPVALNNPETARFQVVPVNGSNIVGTVTGVTGSSNTRDVTVNLTSGVGEFRLRVVD